VIHNPFFHRGPIRELEHFHDRQQETEQIANLVRVSQSVSIIGPRRIGKTSLIYHLAEPHVRKAHDLLPPTQVIVLADAQGMGQASPAEVYAVFIEGLRATLSESAIDLPQEASLQRADHRTLDRLLKSLSQRGTKVAFVVDEFEGLAANRNLDPVFFSGLRGLASRYSVSFVLASQSPLISLVYADHSVLSSPFFNIFATISLGLLDEASAREMVSASLSRAGISLPEQAADAIMDLAGPHPFFLQVAAYHACELAQARAGWDEHTTTLLSDVFYEEAHPHYQYSWHNLDETGRYVLANLTVKQWDPAVAAALRRLQQQCLIRASDTGYRYLSSAMRRFVRGQTVAGLLQAEPFVVDLRAHTVTAGDEPLKLTKTQFEILAYLAQRPGQAVTTRELEENIWHEEYVEDPERLKAAIKHLRRALGPWAGHIVNERGVGYALRVRRQ